MPGALGKANMRHLLLAALLASAPSGPAAAHAILVSSQPALRGAVPAGETRIVLRFNSRIDPARSQLLLTHPDRTQTPLPIEPGTAADTLATSAKLAPGSYSVRWQVLAIDGHITHGSVPFTVRAAGA